MSQRCQSAVIWMTSALLLLMPPVSPSVVAQTVSWSNAAGGVFSTGANWTGGVAPGIGSSSLFGLSNTYTVTFSGSPTNVNMGLTAGTVTLFQSGAQTYTLSGAASVSGGTHTINGLNLTTSSVLGVSGTGRLTVNGGSDVTATTCTVGNLTNGTLIFSGGYGTRFIATSAGNSYLGRSGGVGYIEFSDSSFGSFAGNLGIAESGSGGSSGTFIVSTGADVEVAGNISVAASGAAGQTGHLIVDGPGAVSFTQTGAGTMTIGAAANSAGTVDITGSFTRGTGLLTINPTGNLIVGSTFNCGGSVLFNGGGYARMQSLSPSWNVAGRLDISSGQLVIEDGYLTAQTLLGFENIDLNVGTYDSARITIDGGSLSSAYSSLEVDSTITGGGTVTLQLKNSASFNPNTGLTVGGSGDGRFEVLSGSTVSTETLYMFGGTSADVSMLIDGAGSVVTIERAFLGGSITPPSLRAKLQVQNGGQLNVSPSFTRAFTIGASGLLEILNGGTVVMGPTVTLTGQTSPTQSGLIRLDGGTLSLENAAQLSAYNVTTSPDDGGTMEFDSGTLIFRSNSSFDAAAIDVMLGPSRILGFGRFVQVLGTATLASAMTLDGGTFSVNTLVNGSQLQLLRGTLNISSGSLTVGAAGPFGAQLSLPSVISVNTAGTNVVAGALLHLDGAKLTASGSIANSGEILLAGGVSQLAGATLNNGGLVRGNGRVSARLVNNSTGTVRLGSDDYLLFHGASNNNSGTINLLGGIVEFSAASLTNNSTGRILGRGSLLAPLGITNHGTMTLSGGASEVQGNLTNTSTALVTITGGSQSTFYNAVTNQAGSQFKVSDASIAAFLGTVTGLAAFTGNGTIIFEGPASGGPLAAGAAIVEPTGALIADTVRQSTLIVRGDAQILPNGATSATSRLNVLTIDAGMMDLSDNDLVLDYAGASPIEDIRSYLASGALFSSTANSSVDPKFAIGYMENTTGLAIFSGQSVDSTSLLVAYTLRGDSNLDGKVNTIDFNALAGSFGQANTFWANGDFNYDAVVNSTDFNQLIANYGSKTTVGAASQLGAVVPEPTWSGFIGIALILRGRRQRR